MTKITEAQVKATFKKVGITYSDERNEAIAIRLATETMNDPYRAKGDLARSARITEEQEILVDRDLSGTNQRSILDRFKSAAIDAVNNTMNTVNAAVTDAVEEARKLGNPPKDAAKACEAAASDYEAGKQTPAALTHCIARKL